jgi:hypothetical protein
MRRARSHIVVCLLVLCLCYTTVADLLSQPVALAAPPRQAATPTPATATSAPAADGTLGQIINQLPTIKKLIDKIQRQLDASQVDLDALTLTLGDNPKALVDWVRTNIAFEQYPGLLRGTRGTLIGRAGNALDTAFLLARLLDNAGYEARVVHSTLSPDAARTLVDQMVALRPATATAGDQARLTALLVELGQAFGLSKTESQAQVDAALAAETTADPAFVAAQADAAFILTTLDEAGVTLGDDSAIDALVTEAADYFWVQYRLSAGQPWQAAHPAFKDVSVAPKRLPVTETFFDEVPPELLHKIRIEVTIEQKVDDQLATAVIMPAWERPVAALVGQPLLYRNNPISLQDPTALLDLTAALAKPVTFAPSFNNDLVLDGLGFDLNGATYDLALLSGDTLGVTQIGQTIGNALEEATGALGGADSETTDETASDLITLTGQWIDYTLIAPGGAERTFRRMVLDRIGAENRAAGLVQIAPGQELPVAAAPLLTQQTILVMPGNYSAAYVAQRYLDGLKNAVALLDYLHEQMPFGDEPVAPPLKLLTAVTPFDDVVLNTLFARHPPIDSSTRSYRAEPYLVVLEDGLTLNQPEPVGFLRVDVINNTRRAYTVVDDQLQIAPQSNVHIGAWETHAEQSPFAGVQGRRFSTMSAFAAAAAAGAATTVITPADPAALTALALPTVSAQAITRDLERGYVVIVPAPIASGDFAGWWRIHPQTGETLGLAGDGRGDSAVEYSFLAALKENLILGAPSTMAGFAICMAGSSGSVGCCSADAVAAYGAGAFLGAAVAYKSASAAILLGEALKFGGIFGGATGATPSFCNIK